MNLSVLVSESTDKLKPLLRPRKTICEVKKKTKSLAGTFEVILSYKNYKKDNSYQP